MGIFNNENLTEIVDSFLKNIFMIRKIILKQDPICCKVDDIYKCLGKNISKAINEIGISQKKFAEKLKIHQLTLSYWVNGKKLNSIDNVAKIAKLTGKSICWFFMTDEAQEKMKYYQMLESKMKETSDGTYMRDKLEKLEYMIKEMQKEYKKGD